jgi:hypothetical protein
MVRTFQKPNFRLLFTFINRILGLSGVVIIKVFNLRLNIDVSVTISVFLRNVLKVEGVCCKPRAQPSSFFRLGTGFLIPKTLRHSDFHFFCSEKKEDIWKGLRLRLVLSVGQRVENGRKFCPIL